ncbi:hypothetical protein ABFS82_06G020700 [Erythranthe guttata]
MSGGGDPRRMSIDNEALSPLAINSRALVISDPSQHVGQNIPFSREDTQNGMHGQTAESIVNYSKKLQDSLKELGARLKHHEDNFKYLKTLKNKLDDSILEMQVAIGKYQGMGFPKGENEDPTYLESEEETIQHILKYENSAAALFCKMKSNPVQLSDHSFTKDVIGVVAMLGKVDDTILSSLLSDYLGLETMLAIVCKTYEGVRAMEEYSKHGSINKGLGIHALAASTGRPLDDRFLVICLENLRPYSGQLIGDDPQRRLDLLKPRLINGETPPGFLGFAVNMITIDNTNLFCNSKTGYSLRETLFYYLFSNTQVYKTRDDMLKALPCIPNGAISLDGGVIRGPGIFSMGHHREDIRVKFPIGSKPLMLPASYFEIEGRLKETKWKKDRTSEDMQREQTLLDRVIFNYETKKREFVKFLAESSPLTAQYHMGNASTPR